VVVGGDPRKRGQVQSASPEAEASGVRVGMPMLEALERCPRARAIRTDMKLYREISVELRTCLREEVDALEPAGLEAAFLDGSRLARDAEELARHLAARVREKLELPLRIGIAPVKFLARLAAEELPGGEGVLRIRPGEETAFLHPLPVGRLPGVGPKTSDRLQALGAPLVGDLLRLGRQRLEKELGNHGLRILEFARGQDSASVRAARHPKSLSQESTFEERQLDLDVLWERLQLLAQSLEEGLRRQGLCARRVAVKVRYEDQSTTTRSHTHGRALSSAAEIFRVASTLLDRTLAGSRPIRRIGIALSRLSPAAQEEQQLELFSDSQ
jgi:DNA polymerase-4